MNNNPNNKNNQQDLQGLINGLLGKAPQASDDIKRLISSLSEDDINKISGLMKNQDLQKIASSIIDAQKRKE